MTWGEGPSHLGEAGGHAVQHTERQLAQRGQLRPAPVQWALLKPIVGLYVQQQHPVHSQNQCAILRALVQQQQQHSLITSDQTLQEQG